jgi:hypothetical protein
VTCSCLRRPSRPLRTLEKNEAFIEGKLLPALAEVGIELRSTPTPPEIVEVHNRWPG